VRARAKAERIGSLPARTESSTSSRFSRTYSSPVTATSGLNGPSASALKTTHGSYTHTDPPTTINGRCGGSIRQASRIIALHRAVWRLVLETRNRSGTRPSSRMRDGRKYRFHCWSTMRVLRKPESTIAEPTARGPAGAIRLAAYMKGSISVRLSKAQAITVDRSCFALIARRRLRMSVSSPGLSS
jgi:hypothetical protein